MRNSVAAVAVSLLTAGCATPATRSYTLALEIDQNGAAHQSDRIGVHQEEVYEGTEVNPRNGAHTPYRRVDRRLYSCYRTSTPGNPVCYQAKIIEAEHKE